MQPIVIQERCDRHASLGACIRQGRGRCRLSPRTAQPLTHGLHPNGERVEHKELTSRSDSPDPAEQAKALLDALPDRGDGWYVEDARPGHDDEARVYGGGHWGVCKPTTPRPDMRRPIAEFIAAAPRLIRELLALYASSQQKEKEDK
jgi:hypothetical protein